MLSPRLFLFDVCHEFDVEFVQRRFVEHSHNDKFRVQCVCVFDADGSEMPELPASVREAYPAVFRYVFIDRIDLPMCFCLHVEFFDLIHAFLPLARPRGRGFGRPNIRCLRGGV